MWNFLPLEMSIHILLHNNKQMLMNSKMWLKGLKNLQFTNLFKKNVALSKKSTKWLVKNPNTNEKTGFTIFCVVFRKNPPYLKAADDQWCTFHHQSVCAAHGLSVVTHLSLPQRPSSLISDSSVEPVPSPSGSSPSPSSSSSTPFNDITSSVQSLNTTTTCTANVSRTYWNCLFFYLRRSGLFKNTNKDLFPFWISVFFFMLQDLKDYPVYPDPSLKAFEGATLRYASLKLK